jgi:hypothetical protein
MKEFTLSSREKKESLFLFKFILFIFEIAAGLVGGKNGMERKKKYPTS